MFLIKEPNYVSSLDFDCYASFILIMVGL